MDVPKSKATSDLYCIVEGGLVLDVARVDVDAALDEEAHQVGALHGVDQAGAAKVVRLLHVGAGAHQTPDQTVDRSMDVYSDLDHWILFILLPIS